MSAEDTQTETEPRTAEGWKKRKVHKGITLPSGQVVDIQIPNLPVMAESGELPNELLDSAMEQNQARKITLDLLKKTWEFTKFIIPKTVVSPAITEADVVDLPTVDLEMLASFASRKSDMDAVGHQLGGLETVKSFRQIRGIFTLDEALADSEGERADTA